MKKQPSLLISMILVAVVFGFAIYGTVPRKVPVVGASDPQIVRLKEFATARHLHWKMNIPPEGEVYCASLRLSDPYHYEVGCDYSVTQAVTRIIDRWNSDYGEPITIAEGD